MHFQMYKPEVCILLSVSYYSFEVYNQQFDGQAYSEWLKI